jgi:hypothetical protein
VHRFDVDSMNQVAFGEFGASPLDRRLPHLVMF